MPYIEGKDSLGREVRAIYAKHEGATFGWVLELKPNTRPPIPKITCDQCLGRGVAWTDSEDTTCPKCNGVGAVTDPTYKWDPVPPPELVEAMKKAWIEAWNEHMNKNFELK